MVAAVAFVALVSCNKETNSSLQPAPVSDIKFEAEIAQTKTSIGDADENGYRNVTWDLGEQVYINGSLFTATGRKEDGKAIFETENLDFTVAEQYDAIYPATAGKSLEAVTIPTEQDGTFANAAIAVAQSENRSLAFMNVASLIKFQVESKCSTITITSNSNLTGKVSVTFDENGYPVLGSSVSEPSKTITLTGAFEAGQEYYVAALPGSHTFTVHIDSYLSKEGTNPVTLTRSNIANLKQFPAPTASDIYLKGGWNGWGTTTPLYKEGVWYVARNVTATKSDFKFHDTKNDKWMGKQSDFYLNNYCQTKAGEGDNIPLGAAGTYDFYLNQENTSIYVTTAGGVPPGVKRPVRLLIKNNGKSAMNIYVWYSENSNEVRPCGDWPGKAVDMKNKVTVWGTEYICYEFGAEYYGKTMNYIINWNGGQTGNVEGVYWGQDNYYNL